MVLGVQNALGPSGLLGVPIRAPKAGPSFNGVYGVLI